MNGSLLSYPVTDKIPAPSIIVRCPYCNSHKVIKMKKSIKWLCPKCVQTFEVKK